MKTTALGERDPYGIPEPKLKFIGDSHPKVFSISLWTVSPQQDS